MGLTDLGVFNRLDHLPAMVDVTRCAHQCVDHPSAETPGSLSCAACSATLPANWECVECDWRGRVLSLSSGGGREVHTVVLHHACAQHA